MSVFAYVRSPSREVTARRSVKPNRIGSGQGWDSRVAPGAPQADHAAVALPAGFFYLPVLFEPVTGDAHLRGLIDELAWQEREFEIYGRRMPMPRLIAMYGPAGYRYSGVVHPPRSLTPRLEAIRTQVEAASGRRFNSVLANLYRDGRDSIGWHRDGDYAHGGQPDIASLSFGALRRFEFDDRAGGRCALDLEPGSLLVMTGDAVARWWHRVPKTKRPIGPRVNLTFRHMLAA